MRKNQSKHLKLPVIMAAVLLAIAGAGAITWMVNKRDPAPLVANPVVIPEGGVNLNPPTNEEKQQAEENKKQLAEKSETPPPNTNNSSVTPVITYAGLYQGNIEAAGYVQSKIEDGGICKYTFIQETAQVVRQTTGVVDAKYTGCPAVRIPRGEFPTPGAWKLVLSYSSADVSGSSAEQTITIQ